MPKNVEVDHNPMVWDVPSEPNIGKKYTSVKEIGKMKTRMALLQNAQEESMIEEGEKKGTK
jgi:hypothetical protein